jgi:hypothetical protein
MARLRRHWQAIGVAAWACACAATAASAQALGPEARRFAKCERIPDARRLDAKQPAGVAAVNCAIAPGLRLAILLDETVSWPIARKGDRPWVSLKNPLAAKAWFPNTSPVRVRFDKDMYALVRGADTGRAPSSTRGSSAARTRRATCLRSLPSGSRRAHAPWP